MKILTIFFIFIILLVSPLSAMDIIAITVDDSFNFFFSFIFYVLVALTPFYVVAIFLM